MVSHLLGLQQVQMSRVAEVRIGFDTTDGSWSYVGRDILSTPHTASFPGESAQTSVMYR